ncbi:hypothetical protein LshimejAT787_2600090 [Lyophyllum shimeji]|uniref:Secreted protein n=1 Tax=Lyophyllum shimeji TaxID=47721 RepID=A0A9P3Q2V8_LYOSH|nr:hypothetical protein LshimejAT787_2600090 [Lyophyllum shimeji]
MTPNFLLLMAVNSASCGLCNLAPLTLFKPSPKRDLVGNVTTISIVQKPLDCDRGDLTQPTSTQHSLSRNAVGVLILKSRTRPFHLTRTCIHRILEHALSMVPLQWRTKPDLPACPLGVHAVDMRSTDLVRREWQRYVIPVTAACVICGDEDGLLANYLWVISLLRASWLTLSYFCITHLVTSPMR